MDKVTIFKAKTFYLAFPRNGSRHSRLLLFTVDEAHAHFVGADPGSEIALSVGVAEVAASLS